MSIKGNSVGHPLPDPRRGLTMQGDLDMNGFALKGVSAAQVGALPESHGTNKANPHGVTAAQVGALSASHGTNKANPHGVTAAQTGAIPAAQKGAAGGVATLDGSGKVTAQQTSAGLKSIEDVTSYTLKAEDAGKLLIFSMSSGTTNVTIPVDANLSLFPLGSELEISKWNSGLTVKIKAAGDAINIRTKDANELSSITVDGKYGIVALKRIGTSKWYAAGDLA